MDVLTPPEGRSAAPTGPAGAPPVPGFEVRQAAYTGDLAGLARALRARRTAPADVDLLALVRDVLAWFERESAHDLEGASIALPQVARVVELKLRLLLPRPPRDPEDEEDESDAEASDALQAIALLEDLESAIDFLRRRRFERAVVVPARAPRPDLPRPQRPLATTAGRLAALASNLGSGGYFEMARDRLTLESAVRTLRRALASLGRGTMDALHPTRSWAERTVVFAGMLELVREGRVHARQEDPYGEIELSRAVSRAAGGASDGAQDVPQESVPSGGAGRDASEDPPSG